MEAKSPASFQNNVVRARLWVSGRVVTVPPDDNRPRPQQSAPSGSHGAQALARLLRALSRPLPCHHAESFLLGPTG